MQKKLILNFMVASSMFVSTVVFSEPCEYNRCKANPCQYDTCMDYSFHEEPCECIWKDWTAFIGADYEWNHINRAGDWKRLLPSSAPSVDMYVGGRVLEYFGAEFGYETIIQRKRHHNFVVGDSAFGTAITQATAGKTLHRSGLFGWHFDFKGYLPINEYLDCFDLTRCFRCLDLVGTVGYGVSKPLVHFSSHATAFNQQSEVTLKGKKHGGMRLGGGAELMLTDLLGIRGMLRVKDFSRTRVRNHDTSITLPLGGNRKTFTQAISASIGLFMSN